MKLLISSQTRENALQLLIFSLVTFPSTEFKLDTVASRVVTMVADRRRRVRQAALDTLAVLAQIYDSEVSLVTVRESAKNFDGHRRVGRGDNLTHTTEKIPETILYPRK